jgi:CBS domain-containing protein
VAAAAYLMKHAGATALVALDGQWPGRPAGVITKADIARAAAAGQDLDNVRIRDLLPAGRKEQAMKAIAIDGFGAPPRLRDLPVPEPGEGEILVRVRASSVNGFDVSVAHGDLQGRIEHRFPVVLGRDFAGTVEAAGPGVTSLRPGQAVFGVVTKPALGVGAFGQYVTAPVACTARIPAGLDLAAAGALGLAGTAALAAVDAVAPLPGETVLVSGANGGVGAFAVQLAAARGRIASTAGLPRDQPGGRAVQATPVTAVPDSRTLERLAADVAAGQLTVPVQTTYPLADVPARWPTSPRAPAGSWPSPWHDPSRPQGLGPSPEPARTRPRRQGRDGPGHCLHYTSGIGQPPSTYSPSRCDPMSQITGRSVAPVPHV